jgi:dihydroceramidase
VFSSSKHRSCANLLTGMEKLVAYPGGDPNDQIGFWGAPTGSVDWCEPNYIYSPYVAEFFNTLSSLCIFLVALWGLVNGLRHRWVTKTLVPFALMALVGLGSMAFHGTLSNWGQSLDELPMLWAASSLLYLSLEPGRTVKRAWLAPAIFVYCLITTALYLTGTFLPKLLAPYNALVFVYFLGSYMVLVLSQFYFAVLLSLDCPSQPQAWGLLMRAAVFYISGFFFLWLPDLFYCKLVQAFSFHAWFHLTSCVGPYFLIQFFALVCNELAKPPKAKVVLGTSLCCVPHTIVRGKASLQ